MRELVIYNRSVLKLFLGGLLVAAGLFVSCPADAQITPVTNYPCDPRSTANGGVCPTNCVFPPATERGCNCFDSVDNDGDGRIDAADPECGSFFGLEFVGSGSSNCSIVPPGGSPFASIGAPIGSQQNTADTQSKVAVGDVDNDGIPDAVITSKWNGEVRVVATTNTQPDGTGIGKVKADFNLSGKKNDFPSFAGCTPNRLLFEHEVLIADVDRAPNGRAEIFAIASNRGGNPKTPPSCFYLVALRYNSSGPGGLDYLYPPVPLGTNRPGIFGIADMDGDGKAELYLRDRVYAAETGKLLASEGSKTETNTALWDSDVSSGPVAVTVLGDNKMELVCGTKIYGIPSLTNRNPASPAALTLLKDMNVDFPATRCFVKLMNDPSEYGVDTHSATSAADIDRDGNIDIVISGALNSTGGRTAVFYWNIARNNVSFFQTPSSAELGLPPADPNFPRYISGWIWGTGRVNIGDANGDGRSDLAFVAGNQIFCLTTGASGLNLIPLWSNPRTIEDSRSGVLTVSIYDFNNDGKPEMVYRDSQSLTVIDASTGQNMAVPWSVTCQSHTYTEGPVIADVNGDGATDICITCNTSNSFDINADIQQQALGQVRLYFSNTNAWLPTRKVWNQPGYFVVNINDDLTLPFPQINQNLVFSNAPCPNGVPGPQQPLNVFLNQVPYMNANGCPVFPAPDLTFIGQDPATADPNDPNYFPAVVVTPPICGNLDIDVVFNLGNTGDLPITDNVPVSFFNGDPRLAGATRLFNTTLNIVGLQIGDTLTTAPVTFNGPGTEFDLYVVLYNDGSVLPITLTGASATECQIANNIYRVRVTPSPFTAVINKVQDNNKCVAADPNTGELRARVFVGPTEDLDFSKYSFQWYTGVGTASPIPAGSGGQSSVITGLPEGDYTLTIRNTQKNCSADTVSATIILNTVIPAVSINLLANQTNCNPPNGSLEAVVAGGNTGFTFAWFSNAIPLGIITPTANGLKGDNYTVVVSRNGCTTTASATVADQAIEPDAQASVLQNVVDCANLSSGSITGQALLGGVAQNPAEYTFDWYFYNNVSNTRGSILPAANGTGPTRTGLTIGFYQLVVTRISTQCQSTINPIVEITDSRVLPEALVAETSPQTSCDPNQSNGVLTGNARIGGVLQNPANFTFEWFRGDNTLPANAHTFTSGVNGQVANRVQGGGVFYTVKVTTANNCSDTEKIIISEDINVPLVTLTPFDNSICDPAIAGTAFNGSISASVTFDGVAISDFTNYQFTWHNGTQTTDPVIVVADDKLPTLAQLANGDYTVVVQRTDLFCNSIPVSTAVGNARVLPTITTGTTPSTNCPGGANNGAVTVSNVVPAGPYTFRWYTGNSVNPGSELLPLNTATITGLAGGQNYTVEVTINSSGCKNSETTALADNKANPLLALVSTPNSICDGALGFNGTVQQGSLTDVNALGGDTYTFAWSTGTDMTNPIGGQTASSLTNRNGGFYTAQVRNNRTNCISDPVSREILNSQVFPVITTTSVPSTNCAGGAPNGSTTASVGGVTAGFTFNWFAGSQVTDPPVPVGNGGNSPATNALQGGLTYTVQVRNNSSGCTSTESLVLADRKEDPVLALGTTPNSICDGTLGFNGTALQTALVDNNALGGDTYTFAWSTGSDMTNPIAGQTASTLASRNGGFYTATVRNNRTNCLSAPVTVEILNNQVFPVITINSTGSTNCPGGNPNGTTSANVAGATAGFTFSWFAGNLITDPPVPVGNGGNNFATNGLQGGLNYTVLVRNNLSGCTNTETVLLADNKTDPILTLTPAPNSICDGALGFNGSITQSGLTDANALVGDTYTFLWSTGTDLTNPIAGQTTSTLANRNGGFYTATVTNNRTNCTSARVTVEIINDQLFPVLVVDATGSTNCDPLLKNGVASLVTVDGVAPNASYSYSWFQGLAPAGPVLSTTASATALQGGPAAVAINNYTVEVTRLSSGCKNTATAHVPDNSQLPLLNLTPQPNTICDPAKATLGGGAFDGQVLAAVLNIPGGSNINDYFFDWSVGADGNGVNLKTGLADNMYTVTALHNPTGCLSNVFSAQVVSAKVLPTIDIQSIASQNCPGGAADGTAFVNTVLPVGRTYDYKWYDGNAATGPVRDTDATYQNVQGGLNGASLLEYTVEVTILESGCVNTATVGVADDRQLPQLGALTPTNNTFCVGSDGSAAVSTLTYRGVAQAAPYAGFTFLWSNGNTGFTTSTPLAAGSYTLTVTNTNDNCTSNPVSVTINDNLYYPVINIAAVDQTSCDPAVPNGILTATVDETTIGGGAAVNAGYVFQWRTGNDFDAGANVTTTTGVNGQVNQLPGNLFYVVKAIRSVTGCETTRSIFEAENLTIPSVSLVPTAQSQCTVQNGSVAATVVPAPASTYTYYWLKEQPFTISTDTAAIIAAVKASSALPNRLASAGANDNHTGLPFADYTLVVYDRTTRCIAQPVTTTVADQTTSNVTFSVTGLPTSCATNDGAFNIQATRNDATPTTFTFEIHKGGPTNAVTPINFVSNPPTFDPTIDIAPFPATLPPVASGANVNTNPTLAPGINSSIYTIIATDGTGCKSMETFFLPFLEAHQIDETIVDSRLCPYTIGDGSISVRTIPPPAGIGAGANQTRFTYSFYEGGNAIPANLIVPPSPFNYPPSTELCNTPGIDEDGDGQFDATDPDCNNAVTVPNLAPGFYTVEIRENISGAGCKVFEVFEVKALSLPPDIDLASAITANSACGVANFNGEIDLVVGKNPNDANLNPVTYTIQINSGAFQNNVPAGNYLASNLGPGSYTFDVTASTGCTATRSYDILDEPVIAQLVAADVAISPAEFCDPLLERSARVIVSNVKLPAGANEVITDYRFDWVNTATNTNVLSILADATANNGVGGEEFRNNVPPGSGTVPAGTVVKGIYEVTVTKVTDASTTSGVGCTSAPFTIIIEEDTVEPQITLTPTADTSCDPTFFEGSIRVDVATASGPGAGATYQYTWNPTGAGGQPINSVGNSGLNNVQLNINDGAYTLLARNEFTGCSNSLATTLLRATPPVFTLNAVANNLTSCGPFNGSVNGLQVFVNGLPGVVADFDYVWYQSDPNSVPVLDGTNLVIPVDTQLALATFPAIALDKYFVKAVRKAGGAGVGCESAALRRDILDDRVFPQITTTTVASTSCNANFDGSISVTAATTGFGAGTLYNFDWTANPLGTVITDALGVASPRNFQSEALGGPVGERIGPGGYSLTVTNTVNSCSSTANVTLLQNTIPVEVTTATSAPLTHCTLPDGSVSATAVTVNNVASPLGSFGFSWTGPGGPYAGATVNNLNLGDYFVTATKTAITSPASGCASAPFKVTVDDDRRYPVIGFTTIGSTACNNNFDGAITVSAVTSGFGAATPYNFDWTSNPVGTVITDATGVGSPRDFRSQALGGPVGERIGPGTYGLTVTNATNSCFTVGTITLQQNVVPVEVVSGSATPLTHCTVPNGSVNATGVTVNSVASALTDFSFGWTGPGGPYAGTTINNLGAGDYFVTATKTATTSPASGCASPPFKVTVDDDRVFPVVGFATLPSTSCNTNFDGAISVSATTTGFGAGTLYNFDWTANPVSTVITDALGVTSPRNFRSEALGGPAGERVGQGNYTITVTNTVNTCTSVASVVLQSNTIPVEVTTATSTPLTHCTTPDGSATVTAVNVNQVAAALGDFTFSWTGTGGPYAGVTVNNLTLGDYAVRATKVATSTPASGCSSPPFNVTVVDSRRYPTLAFTSQASTSCDNQFDGAITVAATTQGFGAGTNYNFDWTTNPAGTTITDINNVVSPRAFQSQALGGPVGERIGPGGYTIRVTNSVNQCFSDGSVTLNSSPQPVDILTVTKQDQDICFADGSITVTSLNSGVVGNYSFQWFRNSLISAPLVDAGSVTITTPTLSAPTYPTMGAGTYFVRAIKNTGLTPGSGCITPPFRVDVEDIHEDPILQFAFTANSSCNVADPNAVITGTATERDATIDSYTFTWQLNGGALAPTTVQNDVANTSQLSDSPEGDYRLTAFNTLTGCSFTSNVLVDIDLSVSLPNAISINKTEPTTCIGDGSAQVVSITIGGVNTFSGAAINPPNFTYEWFAGSIAPGNLLPVNNPLLTPLASGKYFLRVTDNSTDCQSALTEVELLEQNIVYPLVEITLTTPQISCDALIGTGVLQSTADGQTDANPNYTFNWFANLTHTAPVLATTSTITSVVTGNYSLRATDLTTGCSTDAIYIVPNNAPQFLPSLAMSAQDRTLCVGQDGALFSGIVNIDPAYPFALDYTANFYLGNRANDPTLPSATPDISNLPPEPGFAQNFIVNNLTEGFYTIRIIDNNTGCAVAGSVEVRDRRAPPVVVVREDNPLINCDPARANGQLSATADNNQIAGYTFDWYSGSTVPSPGTPLQTGDKLIGQTAGTYVVRVVRLLTGCQSDQTGTITNGTVNPPAPTALVERNRTNCLVPNGWVSANVAGQIINHIFNWYNGGSPKPLPDFTGANYLDRDIGPYTVTATDMITGCLSLPTTVTVTDQRIQPLVELSSRPALCLTPTGSVNITLINNQDVTLTDIFWYDNATNGNVGAGPDVYELPAGVYTAEYVSSEGCSGTANVEVVTEILSYNLVSVNGDGANDVWIIDCLQNFPNNNVKVFNRSGVLVYEADGYDNTDVVFRGLGEKGWYALGNQLPDGTYFYIIDKRDGSKPVTGYLELIR